MKIERKHFADFSMEGLFDSLIDELNKKFGSSQTIDGVYKVEDFREATLTDTQLINKVCAMAKPYEAVLLGLAGEPISYAIDDSIILKDKVTLKGYGTDMVEVVRKAPKDYAVLDGLVSTELTLNTTQGLKVSDFMILYEGDNIENASTPRYITQVINDTKIKINLPFDDKGGNKFTWPDGSLLVKSYSMVDYVQTDIINETNTNFLQGLTFNGNKDETFRNAAYYINSCTLLRSLNKSIIKNCRFINMPNETIVGHNLLIQGCSFSNLNGSPVHFSASKTKHSEATLGSEITNCTFENTNKISTKFSGHSEGVFTTSNSGGYFTIKDCSIKNSNGAALVGSIYPSLHDLDYGTNNITIEGNDIESVEGVFYAISDRPGEISDVKVLGNKFKNVKVTTVPADRKGILVQQNEIG
jgi:hypothetical protein